MYKISLDVDSATPLVTQITGALRVALVDGHLKPTDELPSVRRAAIDLGVHFNTIAEAYRQLADEGWLQLSHGRNARVVCRPQPKASCEDLQLYSRRLRELISQMRAAGIDDDFIVRELSNIVQEKSK
jgi:GntR family transcriptional regulator